MKNPHEEHLRRVMRQYHRNHQWRLENGLFVPHAYLEPRKLSWWDDVGFILNRRRVMVWWIHPRMKYADMIDDMARKEADDPPPDVSNPFDLMVGKKLWKKVGRSRKKVTGYEGLPTPDALREYYNTLRTTETRMRSEGIGLVVRPSMAVKAYPWCTGISLCIPIEVRNKEEIGVLAALARRLIKGETTLANEFTDYQYRREDWLLESDLRNQDRQVS